MDLREILKGAEAAVIIREQDGERKIFTLATCQCHDCLAQLAEDLMALGARLEARVLAAEAIEVAGGGEAVPVALKSAIGGGY